MTLLLAGTGAGKSSVNRPIDFIMEDIRLRDAENLKRERRGRMRCCAKVPTRISARDLKT